MSEIYTAISECMAEVGAIGKDQYNDQQKFKYRGVEDVMNALQPVLIKHKVFAVPEVLDEQREERESRNGAHLIYTILRVKYTFYASDGSSVTSVVVGEGMDSGDKSCNKAMAIAFKYACFQVFCIPTEEIPDPDGESPVPQGDSLKPKGAKPEPKAAPKPTGKITKAQAEQIWSAIKAKFGANAHDMLLPLLGTEKLAELPAAQFADKLHVIEAYQP